jgi:UDP-3-O-[3-hydroxymyristoyl] N-acetylglucosamine deacetylase/3-hydroxyacyl-[acyl-carrier-protein] dehydratase
MADKQRTIKEPVSFQGVGLHTGKTATITFKPAPVNYGYRFVRTDLPENVEIPALVDYVVDLSRGTTLGIGDVKVHTVEHVVGALAGLEIDNCMIELDGVEPPVGDGSSMPYVEVLKNAGIVNQDEDRYYLTIDETIRYTNEEKGVDIVALPLDDYRITVMVDYYNPALGSQHTGLFDLKKEFVGEFAPARTFCFLTEVESLIDQGLIQGGNLDNAIVIVDRDMSSQELMNLQNKLGIPETPKLGENGILNNTVLRYKNEPARHKLLDMLGDLALAGVRIKAQILAARPGHASNFEFAKKIRALYLKKQPLKNFKGDKSKGVVLDIYDLLKIMPHRYPFLLVDKVTEFDREGKSIVGVKNVTMNEPYFIGHFPEKPIMPGVLIMEAMAQTGCLLLLNTLDDFSQKLVLFLGIKNAKFRRQVIPGDQLVMEVKMLGKKFNTYQFSAVATVNGQVAAETEFQAALVDRES